MKGHERSVKRGYRPQQATIVLSCQIVCLSLVLSFGLLESICKLSPWGVERVFQVLFGTCMTLASMSCLSDFG